MLLKFPKIPHLESPCTITEKIDGMNAGVHILSERDLLNEGYNPYLVNTKTYIVDDYYELENIRYFMLAALKTRYTYKEDDSESYNFWNWCYDNKENLRHLGPGMHRGEFWGQGIGRNYGLKERRFSLFNTQRWSEKEESPTCCHVVPVLSIGGFWHEDVYWCLNYLEKEGSMAAPGFMEPEGVVIYHHNSNQMFKKRFR